MNIIYKYKLEPLTINKIRIPTGYKVLTVGIQRNELYLWALVDTDNKETEMLCYPFGTGHQISNDIDLTDFIGTAVSDTFVWHVFKLEPEI